MNTQLSNQQEPQWQTPPQMWAAPTPSPIYQESEQEKQKRAILFKALFLPTLIYALLYAFFLYDNFSGITMPFYVVTTGIYCFYCFKKLGISRKMSSYFYLTVMLLLGISSACTGSIPIIVFNTIGIFLLLICLLLHNFYNDSTWNFGKYFVSIFSVVFGALGCIGDPFSDVSNYQKQTKKKGHSQALYILIGVCIAIPLLVVIISLLCTADAVFKQFIVDLLERINLKSIIGFLLTFIAVWFGAYCAFRYLGKRKIPETVTDTRKFEPLVAITVLSLISIVYLFFSIIQILFLFWGGMQLPESYTFAEYAREGFFQLLFVCILNVAIVLFVRSFFRKSIVLNIFLAVISCCTYIMIASSAFRMFMYVQNYNLTFLRILVFWGLALIALLLAGILIQIFYEKFPLFRYGLVVVCVCYLALSFSHPDYWIAKYNLSQMEYMSEDNMDYTYLSKLSSDAAPIIADYEGPWVNSYVARLAKNTDDSIRQLNISHVYARSLFKEELAQQENCFRVLFINELSYSIEDVNCEVINFDNETFAFEMKQIEDDIHGFEQYEAYIYLENFPKEKYSDDIQIRFYFKDNNGNEQLSDSNYLFPYEGRTYEVSLYGSYDYDHDGIDNEYYTSIMNDYY